MTNYSQILKQLDGIKTALKIFNGNTNLHIMELQSSKLSLMNTAKNLSYLWDSTLKSLPSSTELTAGCLTGLKTYQYYLNMASVASNRNISALQNALKVTADMLSVKMPNLSSQLRLIEVNEIECKVLKSFLQKQGRGIIPLSSLRIVDSLRDLTMALPQNLSEIDELLSSMKLIQEYSSFVQEQYNRILTLRNYHSSFKRLKVIEIATNLLQEQISTISESSIVEIDEENCLEENKNVKTVIQYIPSYLGYALRKDSQYDIDEEFAKSSICKAVEGGKNIIKKIEYINEMSMVSSKGEVLFKPTNRTYSAVSCLSTAFCVNEESFGGVVDSLYQLLYEGSGDAGRILQILTNEESATLWDIKHLRTSFRHDIEHGNQNKYLKKKQEIAKVYQNICGKVRPIKQKDWVKAQLNLFDKINVFLDLILEKLSTPTGV